MLEEVITPRGCQIDHYMWEMWKEFETIKTKYGSLDGFNILIKRDALGAIKISKYTHRRHSYPSLTIKVEYPVKNGYYVPILLEYLATDIDLGIQPGDYAIITRDEGKLKLEYREHTGSKIITNSFYNELAKVSNVLYATYYEPYERQINDPGKLITGESEPQDEWI